jgi:septal ring factor EnvC (AmiA/AmiB activator)
MTERLPAWYRAARGRNVFEMRRYTIVLLTTLIGCGASDQEVAELKRKADEKFEKAAHDAKQKLDEAQKQIGEAEKQIAELKTELADAKAKSEKAQADTDEQTKAAEAALDKARQAFKTAARVELANVNKQIGEVSSKAGKVPAKTKPAFQKSMQTVIAQQKALAKDIAAFDGAALDGLSKLKAQFDKDLALLRSALASAKSKLPP